MLTDPEILQNISANVRRLLTDRDWSQVELARKTGETQVAISYLVHGAHMPGTGVLARVAEAFDVSLDRLVGPPPKKIPAVARKSA